MTIERSVRWRTQSPPEPGPLGKFHPAPIQTGMTRLFGACDLGADGLRSGWAHPEEAHVWNDGPEAVFDITTEHPAGLLRLTVEGEPYLGARVPHQTMTLYVNGFRVGHWQLAEPRTHALHATLEPEQLFARGDTAVAKCVWHLPDSARPTDMGQGTDTRKLGSAFARLPSRMNSDAALACHRRSPGFS